MPVVADRNAMVVQCQGLFAQSLTDQTVTYGTPTANTVGDVTTVHLTAPISGRTRHQSAAVHLHLLARATAECGPEVTALW